MPDEAATHAGGVKKRRREEGGSPAARDCDARRWREECGSTASRGGLRPRRTPAVWVRGGVSTPARGGGDKSTLWRRLLQHFVCFLCNLWGRVTL